MDATAGELEGAVSLCVLVSAQSANDNRGFQPGDSPAAGAEFVVAHKPVLVLFGAMKSNEPRSRPEIGVEELREDMSRSDLITALEYLRFNNGTGLISADRPVRDFVVSALRRR
jgi:hypothetical protein